MLPSGFASQRLILRPIVPDDAPAIFAGYAQDPEVVRYVMWRPHRTLWDTEAFITDCLAASPAQARTYAVVDRTDGQLVGAFGLRRPQPHRLDCGYVLAPRLWGRGLMTEALTTVARWAMRQPEIWRIGAVCDVDNRGSARVMEKAGLSREGILRRWLIHPNLSSEPRDCFSYALTR
jgi:[ribosomal protein S5]-alanine N-acetyltransferase